MKRDRLNEIKKWKDDIDLTGCEVSEHNFYTIHIEWLIEQAERVEELEQQNKRYREAREILEQVYKDSYFRNAYGYEGGYLGGLDTAMDIIDKELEEWE